MSTKKYDGATSGKLPEIAFLRLPSICPTAAKTDRPKPSESTTDAAPSRGPEIEASAHRNAGRPFDNHPPRRDVQRMTTEANARMTRAKAMPPAVQSVSRHVPENHAANPIKMAKAKAITIK